MPGTRRAWSTTPSCPTSTSPRPTSSTSCLPRRSSSSPARSRRSSTPRTSRASTSSSSHRPRQGADHREVTTPNKAWSPGRSRRGSIRSWLSDAAYVLPALGFLTLVLLVPLGMTAGLSFTSWDGLGPIKWVGISNYPALAKDPIVLTSMGNAVVMTVFTLAIPIVIGLATAIVLSRIGSRLRTLWRTLLFLPAVIAPVVVAVGWRLVYEPTTGLLNGRLTAIGLPGLAKPWLGDFGLALPATGVVATWMEYGLVMVLFLAGIQRISPELFDAAKVD